MEQTRRVATVTQINTYIKTVIDKNPHLASVWVRGELSNFKLHYSGHAYMTLKDEGGVLRAVMFKGSAAKLGFAPKDGMKVLAHGRVSVFERDGQYQLYIDDMEQDGIGDLYAKFEELKRRLSEEGLFSDEHKKPLPKYPEKIGIVTAATGAAIKDILNVLKRRFQLSNIYLYPVLVQGEAAAGEIAEAIAYFNSSFPVDVMIIGRGGGSIEDLWAFNEEIVARAVFHSNIPIVSAVGHEVDFTISDFVADLRAPTPSAAAELVVPNQDEIKKYINTIMTRLAYSQGKIIEKEKSLLKRLYERPVFLRFADSIDQRAIYLDGLVKNIETHIKLKLSQKSGDFGIVCGKLDNLSPVKVMERGYAVPLTEGGEVLRSVSAVKASDKLKLKLTDGDLGCVVESVEAKGEIAKK